MPFPIEIKINVGGQVGDALSALGNPHATSQRQIWFAEDPRGITDLPLLSGHVIVRFRSGDGDDDLTVKLRPCLESQLVGRFEDRFKVDAEKLEYRIEGDWSGQDRRLSASLVSERPQGALLDSVVMDDAAIALHPIQRQFVEACAQPPLRIESLKPLGPIAATKWADLELDDLEVNMERWQVTDLDFLELSIRVKAKVDETAEELEDRAARKQEKFSTLVAQRGVVIADDITNKTQRVLTALAAAAHLRP